MGKKIDYDYDYDNDKKHGIRTSGCTGTLNTLRP
jgi:hypothetical protein